MGTSGVNFARAWSQVAALDPSHVAIIGDGRQRTYGEFNARAGAFASYLEQQGLRPGDAVGLLLHNRIEYLEAFFGAAKLRCIPFNVNYRYRGEEIAHLLDDAGAKALVHEASLADEVAAALASSAADPVLIECGANRPGAGRSTGFEQAAASAGTVSPSIEPSGQDLLYLYTGGTTGMPKAVMWRHEDLYDALWQLTHADEVAPDPLDAVRAGKRALTALPASPLMHGTALFIALQTLTSGGTVVLTEGAGFDAGRAIEAMRAHDVALLSIVGDAFARPLVEALAATGVDLPRLRVVVSSGVQWSPAVKAQLLEHLPNLRLIDSLGASEGPASQSVSTKGAVAEASKFKLGGRLRVIDDAGRDLVPGSGEVGMLAIVGPGPIGYLGDPAKSAATFRDVDGVRMTVPGDHASVEADGTITFLGRGSACINTGGEKVFADEVEAVLRSHPAVYDCAVIGVPDERWGERVVALLQVTGDAHEDLEAELDTLCRGALAGYKRPKEVFRVESLGRSAAGKVDLNRLRLVAAQRAATE